MPEDLLHRLRGLHPGRVLAAGGAGERSQDLCGALDLGILLVDATGRVRLANAVAAGLLGVLESQLEGSSVQDPPWQGVDAAERPVPPADQPFARALRSGVTVRDASLAIPRTPGDGLRWLRVQAVPLRDDRGELSEVLCSLRDMSAERAAVEAGRREADVYREVLESTVAGLCVLAPSGALLYANRAAEDVLRLRRGDDGVYASPAWRAVRLDGTPLPEADRPFRRVLRTREAVRDQRHAIEWPGGARKVLSVHGAPVLGPDGEVERIVLAVLDITEQAREEAEQERVQTEADRLARLESLSVLAGGVAHDFNNILVGMLGGAELVRDCIGEDHPARSALELLEQGARRASELTHQLLAFSGKSRFVVGPRDLSDLVGETSHLLRAMASKDARLEFDLAEDLPLVDVDATQFQQVMMNMVLNASQALPAAGGRIFVGTSVRALDADFLRDAVQAPEGVEPGDYVVLEVRDDGCGMPPEVAARVFEPFFTTKDDGHGLGLAAVMGLVGAHGGFVHLESAPGEGTRFLLGLPPTEAIAPQPAEEAAPLGSFHGTVLVVDDEDFVRTVTRRILECEGCGVLSAADGASGLATFREHLGEIDAIVLDLTMPGASGDAVLQEIRAIDPDVRVVVTSGFTDDRPFQGDPTTRFLAKPFGRADLLGALASFEVLA